MTDKFPQQPEKIPYETPKITYVGQIQEIILGGGGKLSLTGGDPGENRKTKSSL